MYHWKTKYTYCASSHHSLWLEDEKWTRTCIWRLWWKGNEDEFEDSDEKKTKMKKYKQVPCNLQFPSLLQKTIAWQLKCQHIGKKHKESHQHFQGDKWTNYFQTLRAYHQLLSMKYIFINNVHHWNHTSRLNNDMVQTEGSVHWYVLKSKSQFCCRINIFTNACI